MKKTRCRKAPKRIEKQHRAELREAKRRLEHPSFLIRAANLLGLPLEVLLSKINKRVPVSAVQRSVHWCITRSFDLSLRTLPGRRTRKARTRSHRLLADVVGGVGGYFGLPGLAIDLPVTTLVTCRSIADIARAEGGDLDCPETRLDCLNVFMLGGPSKSDDGAETGYYASRSGIARSIHNATRYCQEEAAEQTIRAATKAAARVAKKTAMKATEKQAPILVRVIQKVAEKLGREISVKAIGQAMPYVGAGTGVCFNHLFTGHYQDLARGHFTVRRLERIYGIETIERAYKETAI